MLANFLKKSTPAHFIYLILLLLVYFVLTVYPQFLTEFRWQLALEKFAFFWGFVFLLGVEVFVIKKNDLTKDSAYALYFAVLLLGTFNETFNSGGFLGASIFLTLAMRKVFSLKSQRQTLAKTFDAGLWIAVAFLYFNWSVLFLIVLYGGLFNYRLLNWRTVLTPLLGMSSVVLIFFTYHLMFDSLSVFNEVFNFDYSWGFVSISTLKLAIPCGFYLLIVLFGSAVLIPRVITGSNIFKRSWKTLMLQLLVGVAIMLLSPIKNGSTVYFLLLPLPVICTNYLETLHSKWIKNAILFLAFGISIGVYFL